MAELRASIIGEFKGKKAFKDDVFEPIKASDVCNCKKNKNDGSSCSKRCPCKKAERPCQTACYCTDGSCTNPYGCVPKTYAGKPILPASSAGSSYRAPVRDYAGKFIVFSLVSNSFNLGLDPTVEMPLGYRYDTPRDPTYRPGDSRHF